MKSRRPVFYVCVLLLLRGLLLAQSLPPDDSTAVLCIKCHREETVRYLSTPMGSTLIPQKYPDAVVEHETSGSVVTVTTRNGTMFHKLTAHGLTAEYPIRYQIGGGMEGKTFLIQTGNYLFESPISWFNTVGWDLSPGYDTKNVLEFDRAVPKECIFCHATGARFDDPDGKRLATKSLQPITCERCHGPIGAHVQHPSKSNIVNPVKLTGPARDSVCEQCHLEGTNRVLNPGKDWTDFRAGEPTENIFTTYLLQGGSDQQAVPLASEVEQFAQSRCARESNGKFWCSACHNPHRPPAPRPLEVRSVCTSCHQKLSPLTHAADLKECASCHMPSIKRTTISHASSTDHRILRRPITVTNASQPRLIAWREPPQQFRSRNLGIAELLLSSTDEHELWLDGGNLLASLNTETRKTDPEVVFSLQAFYFESGDYSHALEFARRSVELNPQSANAALGLARIVQASGSEGEAEQQFLRAISLNPSWKEAYGRLAMLYVKQRRMQDAVNILDRYLEWNSNEILFRDWKKQLLSQNAVSSP